MNLKFVYQWSNKLVKDFFASQDFKDAVLEVAGGNNISSLSDATTPLTGTESIAILQGNNSVKTTVQDIADLASNNSGGPGYLVYSAFVTYNGSFTINVLQNTIGTTLNWTVPGGTNGVFRATAASGSPFTTGKTVFVGTTAVNSGTPYFVTGAPWFGGVTTTINVNLILHDGTQNSTPFISNMFIEIRVYP